MHLRRVHALVPLVLMTGLVAGCSNGDGPTAPPAPGGAITPLDLARAWPHANGQSFTYGYVARTGSIGSGNLYPTPGEVPAVTLDLVAALLLSAPPFTVQQEETYVYTLTFDDSSTTGSGVRGQLLVPAIGAPVAARASATAPGGVASPPLLLRGGVWRQEAERIALYQDVSAEPAWVFLQGALGDRTPWQTHPLPQLAPEVVMRARAYQTVSADVAGLHRDDALDVHYLFDYGVVAETDGGGGVLGYRRDFDYGRVIWGRDAGPLYVYERRGVTAGDPPSAPTNEETALLEQVSLPALGVYAAAAGARTKP